MLLAPGVYRYRVRLTADGAAPVVIRAADPLDPPVFDYSGKDVLGWPGSDPQETRGAWRIDGRYEVHDVVIRGAHTTAGETACLRITGPSHVLVSGVEARDCDLGIELGAGHLDAQHVRIWGCPAGGFVAYGGTFTLRYSHISGGVWNVYTDGAGCIIENNRFERCGNNPLFLSTCQYGCGSTGTASITATQLVRGNVVVLDPQQSNLSLAVVVIGHGASSDATGFVDRLQVQLVANTFIGVPGAPTVALTCATSQGTDFEVLASDNVFADMAEDVAISDPLRTRVTGTHNWFSSGSTLTVLTDSALGADPGLDSDFRPRASSPLVGAAEPLGALAPSREYYLNDVVSAQYRPRASTHDIGAFELATSGPGFGPSSTDAGSTSQLQRSLGVACGCGASPGPALLFALALSARRWRCCRPRGARP